MRKCAALALEGDRNRAEAQRRGIVPRRPRSVRLEMPKIAGAADIAPAMGAIVRAVAAAAVTPYDGAELAPWPPPQTREERLRQMLLGIVRRHREHPIDLDDASPMELFAVYCFDPDAFGVGCLASG
jgi:hypothetical protein